MEEKDILNHTEETPAEEATTQEETLQAEDATAQEQEAEKESIAEEGSEPKSAESLANKLYQTLMADDLAAFQELLSQKEGLGSVKLGILPLCSVAVLLGARSITETLKKAYFGITKFTELPAPIDLIARSAALFGSHADMYENVHFVEPAEVFIMKGDASGFADFVKTGGIKTLASRKRVESLTAEKYADHVLIPAATEGLYKFAKPRTKKQIITTAIYILIALIVVLTPVIVMASLRTTVTFYFDGAEWGEQTGFAGSKITIDTPTKENYIFTGWYTDEEATQKAEKISKKYSTLYAGWEAIIYTLSLNYQGTDVNGNPVSSLSGYPGQSYTLPVLTKSGEFFLGWYDEEGNRYTSGTFGENATLSPRFEEAVITDGTFLLTRGDQFAYLNSLNVTTIKLANDITLDESFIPCGGTENYTAEGYAGFNYVFDGQGHTITTSVATPLFTVIGENGSVSNLHLICTGDIPDTNKEDAFGLVTLLNRGTIEDVSAVFYDATEEESSIKLYDYNLTLRFVGGLVGMNAGTIRGSDVTGSIRCSSPGTSFTTIYMGGIAGNNTGTMENCINNAVIYSSVNTAGVCGANLGTMRQCKNKGTVTLSNGLSSTEIHLFAAGVTANNNSRVENCVNEGEIRVGVTALNTYQAGIAAVTSSVITNCENKGNVTLIANGYIFYAGGIAGQVASSGDAVSITNCVNSGVINGGEYSSGYIGGIAGVALGDSASLDHLLIEACVNKGEVKETARAGGICGYASYITLRLSRNEGSILATSKFANYDTYAGGIVAILRNSALSNLANVGTVEALADKNIDESAAGVSKAEYEALFTNFAGGIVAVTNGAQIQNVYGTGEIKGSNGYFALIAGGVEKDTDVTIENAHALAVENIDAAWYEYNSSVDAENKSVYENVEGVEPQNLYEDIADMYTIAPILGEAFVNAPNATPIFTWEE